MTLRLRLDLDMVNMSHHNKNEVSMSRYSKVQAQIDTDGQTDKTHRQYENITFPHTRAEIIVGYLHNLQNYCLYFRFT